MSGTMSRRVLLVASDSLARRCYPSSDMQGSHTCATAEQKHSTCTHGLATVRSVSKAHTHAHTHALALEHLRSKLSQIGRARAAMLTLTLPRLGTCLENT
eukprot:2454990-Amphidinium_carterae.1